jgi:hypothetical protein
MNKNLVAILIASIALPAIANADNYRPAPVGAE